MFATEVLIFHDRVAATLPHLIIDWHLLSLKKINTSCWFRPLKSSLIYSLQTAGASGRHTLVIRYASPTRCFSAVAPSALDE